MLDYYHGKLAQINYKIAIHPENANIRLASQANSILVIVSEIIPKQYSKQFLELINLIEISNKKAARLGKGLHPYKLDGIYNKKAANYIKMLLDIEYALELTSGSD